MHRQASAVWEDCKEVGLALWQVSFEHEALESVCFNVLDAGGGDR